MIENHILILADMFCGTYIKWDTVYVYDVFIYSRLLGRYTKMYGLFYINYILLI